MEEKSQNDAFSKALDGILSNPEMMSMISSMASKLKGEEAPAPTDELPAELIPSSSEEPPTAIAAAASPELSGAFSALAPLLSGSLLKGSPEDDRRACLLRALKPYLSKNRSEAIEHIITISRLSHIFKGQN